LDDDCIGSLTHHSRKCILGLVGSTDHYDRLYFSACRATGEQNFIKHGFREDGICRMA
jgi:hypothetical protein